MESTGYEKSLIRFYTLSEADDQARSQNYLVNRELIHACMGLCGETGEIMDLVKKSVNYDKPLDQDKLLEECGDVIHYLARILDLNELTLQDAMNHNLEKLNKRFPEGYNHQAAIQRRDQETSR
ncbi:nucleoside triphosphate pyrophosphohydrolase family protein [Pseudobacteriovorax antillogorgiicola]|uniref:MazG nucleotide pyrophosphohydrolase domain-containing protein n=1 Tax=Pseudobacteriovorax antillogorgiicola TaxID=1513793 RepID=A0A1Y6CAE0_9BACT|nr:nucleoside triphosphate pyrophosphohydrolase family protein [Pseudobacteriovorax antillogorgiicola]TCS49090.1 MazG-like nucleotide pyrophosphohydrolase family protein [Pseudobacteriovorax antillogorgiicola]SMF51828.1 MazG nucleotide pyrophosphohydrolase domain-containing protein [Pseudobacteriovorax antillogorgiicola]